MRSNAAFYGCIFHPGTPTMSLPRINLTEQVHNELANRIKPGYWVIDATAGNGYDSVFLARQVGAAGRLYALDIQKGALETTQQRLAAAKCCDHAYLVKGDHAYMNDLLPGDAIGRIAAIIFNLGYLPAGDKRCTTQTVSTLAALQQGLDLLSPSGCISVLAYPGHAGGREECEAVKNWASQLPTIDYQIKVQIPAARIDPPEWVLISQTSQPS